MSPPTGFQSAFTVILSLLQIAGSLGLFLYGMRVMSDGIQKAAGERLHRILGFMTGNRFTAVLTGFAVTGLIQSSSATTVMVVGFVNAGLLSLVQAIGVIMGANIGTTVTGWIVALFGFKVKIAIIALPALGIGLPLRLSKKLGKQDWGEALSGVGMLFLGLDFLKRSVPDISSNPEILEFVTRFTDYGFGSFVLFVFLGTILTIIVQSSSAAMAITLAMAHLGWIDFPTAAAIVLGENIGTTITAYLASIGTNVSARRASRAHLLFNLLGVVWMAVLFKPFLGLVDLVVPGATQGAGITAHLAMFHTLFNIVNTMLFVGFVKQIAYVVSRIVRQPEESQADEYQLRYISTALQDTAELSILNAQLELSRMVELIENMFSRFLFVFSNPDAKLGAEIEEVKRLEDFTDRMQEDISRFLAQCAQENLHERMARNVGVMIRVAHELENVGDNCFNLMMLTQKRYDGGLKFDEEALAGLAPYLEVVQDFLAFNKKHLNERLSKDELEHAFDMEDQINDLRNKLKEAAQARLQRGGDVKAELLFIDIVRQIEHMGDHSLNVAQALRQVR